MNTTLVVPRIIHNTWKTKDLPPEWQYAREQCMKAHPGYEFMLWTDDSARAMIAKVSCAPSPPFPGYFVSTRGVLAACLR